DGPWQTTVFGGTHTTSNPDGVTAINPAVTAIVSGLATLALATPEQDVSLFQTNTDILEEMSGQLQTAASELTELRAEQGRIQAQVLSQTETLDREETILSEALAAMTVRDQFEAASELSNLETNLEASYLVTSRLASLSLLNFLR
ncbi:MAG: flagellin, partial [Chloroflexota bacterium]